MHCNNLTFDLSCSTYNDGDNVQKDRVQQEREKKKQFEKAYFQPEDPAVAIAATHISKMQKGNVVCQVEARKITNIVIRRCAKL